MLNPKGIKMTIKYVISEEQLKYITHVIRNTSILVDKAKPYGVVMDILDNLEVLTLENNG